MSLNKLTRLDFYLSHRSDQFQNELQATVEHASLFHTLEIHL
jgi:hypothetical protein